MMVKTMLTSDPTEEHEVLASILLGDSVKIHGFRPKFHWEDGVILVPPSSNGNDLVSFCHIDFEAEVFHAVISAYHEKIQGTVWQDPNPVTTVPFCAENIVVNLWKAGKTSQNDTLLAWADVVIDGKVILHRIEIYASSREPESNLIVKIPSYFHFPRVDYLAFLENKVRKACEQSLFPSYTSN